MGAPLLKMSSTRTGLCSDYYTVSDKDKAFILAQPLAPRGGTGQARSFASDRTFARGSSTEDGSSALKCTPLLHSRLRRELLEDQYGTKNLPPSRKFEICDELAALPKPHAVHCRRELPIASHTKLEIFRELELGSQSCEVGLIQQLARLDFFRTPSSELLATVAPARQMALANQVRLDPMPPLEWLEAIKNLPVTPEIKLQLATEMQLAEVIDLHILSNVRREQAIDKTKPMFSVPDSSVMRCSI